MDLIEGLRERVLDILASHRGKENSIPLSELSGHFEGLKGWEMRDLIHEMRQDGILIASSPSGYYLPSTLNEALHYIEIQFRVPSRDQLRTARIQRQAAQRQFGGQFEMFPRSW